MLCLSAGAQLTKINNVCKVLVILDYCTHSEIFLCAIVLDVILSSTYGLDQFWIDQMAIPSLQPASEPNDHDMCTDEATL